LRIFAEKTKKKNPAAVRCCLSKNFFLIKNHKNAGLDKTTGLSSRQKCVYMQKYRIEYLSP